MESISCSCCGALGSVAHAYCQECGHPSDSSARSELEGNTRASSVLWKVLAIAFCSLAILIALGLGYASFVSNDTQTTPVATNTIPSTNTQVMNAAANALKRVEETIESVDGVANRSLEQVSNTANLTPSPVPSRTDSQDKVAYIIAVSANLRSEPNIESYSIREVGHGETLPIIGKPYGAWYKVYDSESGQQGWLHGNTIRLE